MECLKNIVGVTTSENECLLGSLSAEELAQLKVSTSGLFLDDLPGGVHFKAVTRADSTKPFYKMTQDALRNAVKALEIDLLTSINKEHTQARANFVGQIGRLSFAQSMPGAVELFQGIRLRPVDTSAAVLTLQKITLIINQAATFPVYLYKVPYKSSVGTLINTFPLVSTANAFASHQLPGDGLRLPLTENGEAVEYWLFYDMEEANGGIPKDNKVGCLTCESSNGKAPLISQYLEVQGVQFSDTTDLTQANPDEFSHGFTLDVSIKCDTSKLFCSEYSAQDAIAVTMARAVQFKAGELLIEDVLKSPDLNRYTTMDRERLWGKRNHYRADYEGRIAYLSLAIDLTASNCYVCRDTGAGPINQGIFI